MAESGRGTRETGTQAETRKQETGNRKQETGNRKQETGNRKQGTGNREQGTGNREQDEEAKVLTSINVTMAALPELEFLRISAPVTARCPAPDTRHPTPDTWH
jgi:hypothetical protein